MVAVGNEVGYKHDPPLYGTMRVVTVKGARVWCSFEIDAYHTKVEEFDQSELAMAYSLFVIPRPQGMQEKITVPDSLPEDPHAAA